jgi:tetratricopeptide (TPR) repeat protein
VVSSALWKSRAVRHALPLCPRWTPAGPRLWHGDPGALIPEAAIAQVSSLLLARFARLPRRSQDTWQGAILRMPMWVDGPDGTPYRPLGAVWVSLETDLANVKLAESNEEEGTVALDALLELGFKFARTRPATIQVADKALGEQIARTLGDPDLTVTVDPVLDEVKSMVARMAAETNGEPHPAALDRAGMTVERMRAFAAAARDFYAAAPWRHLSDEDLIHVEAPRVGGPFRHVTVLGRAGQTFGLGFFASAKDLDKLHASPDPETLLEDGGRWAVFFGAPWETPFSDLDLWEEHGFPLAASGAYPVAAWFGPSDRMRRPDARELGDIETILLALSRTTEAEIDQGRWSHEVVAHGSPCRVTLAIPELLRPLDAPSDSARHGMPDRRVMERMLLEVQRFAATREFASESEMNDALQAKFTGSMDTIASTASTPVERAQDLVYGAMDARGRRRIQLARKALDLSADCADAYVLLAEECADLSQARDLYLQGVAAGERTLGSTDFAEEAGHFWSDVRTRPYMRARFGLARCLDDLGQRDEALTHYRELLRLNPGDNQGARYAFLNALLLTGRDDEAGALLRQFSEEPTALWQYGWALWAFRREGACPASRQRLRAAFRSNRYLPAYLTGDSEWAGPAPASYAMGSREEAVICVDELGDAWDATPGALEWLATHAPAGKRRKRHRR